jgi:hypothetical protein
MMYNILLFIFILILVCIIYYIRAKRLSNFFHFYKTNRMCSSNFSLAQALVLKIIRDLIISQLIDQHWILKLFIDEK